MIKVGGSLLDLPDLPARLANLLADFSRPRPVLVCGGGPTVELIRRWDRLYGIGEEEGHWIAVRALTLNALVLARILPQVEVVESLPGAERAWEAGKTPLLDVHRFLRDVDERAGDPLPRRWRVTSDSIAARVARACEAPELILLKSVSPAEPATIELAARLGIVDPHFPVAARDVPRVILINLRAEEPKEVVLAPEPAGP